MLKRLIIGGARLVPGGDRLRRAIGRRLHRRRIDGMTTEEVFGSIYRTNAWESDESVSGPGSTLTETAAVRAELPRLIERHGVTSLLDIPCGDFNWMQSVDLAGVRYTGADIVAEIVASNRDRFERPGVRFEHLDLLGGDLPSADLVLVRDCLVHLGHADVLRALRNLTRGTSTWLLTTTHRGRGSNPDIPTGHWHPIDLEAPPYDLPAPVEVIDERHPVPEHADKALGLWRIADVAEALSNVSR